MLDCLYDVDATFQGRVSSCAHSGVLLTRALSNLANGMLQRTAVDSWSGVRPSELAPGSACTALVQSIGNPVKARDAEAALRRADTTLQW